MGNKGVRNMFVFGSLLCFVALVVMTFDTFAQLDSRSTKITADVDKGKQVWHKYDCIGCHTIFGNGSYFAPDMTKITDKLPKSYLKKYLVNPRKVNASAAMPVLGITDDEAEKLFVFLEWISKVDTNGWPPKPIMSKGSSSAAVYEKYSCSSCHLINGIGGTSGPDITHVASRHPEAEWHRKHLDNPSSVVPDSAMPPYAQLTEDEKKQLIEFLVSLK
ncbi:c-type cytochrome [Candidatus Magnetominusculus xianensis]|uniref:Cytochrome C n=1 Tax=Candidatus Magnetominusculus xianensis TaxID=1748249 RepID=A0ABR5SHZ8_9BACT|nr:c-type cytochrome [Candidatus Magnetominusculus xianensis]KWT91860.1 cytochrome C [Candidatus Magnetominusculus xianensis]MBF0404052.1 c-type cytochrome [Nitrospirota bacterium]